MAKQEKSNSPQNQPKDSSLKAAQPSEKPAEWLLWLGTVCLCLLFNQCYLPFLNGKISISDLAFLCGFLPVLGDCLVHKRPVLSSPGIYLLLLLSALTAIIIAPGKGGVLELLQLYQQLFAGVFLMGYLLEHAPRRTLGAVLCALLLNTAFAIVQAFHAGFGAVLPPADVLALPWGISLKTYSGFFRSRMALSFFQMAALGWLLPHCYKNKGGILAPIGGILLTILVLCTVAHGQILLLGTILLLFFTFAYSRRAGLCNLLAILLSAAIMSVALPEQHCQQLQNTALPLKNGEYAGELKTNHLDFFAAVNLARQKVWTGVGAGRYQECVGRCYQDLPNPSWNDIETDTQASWGILLGTQGIPFALCFLLLLVAACTHPWRCRLQEPDDKNCTSAPAEFLFSGSFVLLFTFCAMFLTDPWTRGCCWLPVLALASALPSAPRRLSIWLFLAGGALLALLAVFPWIRTKNPDPILKKISGISQTQETKKVASANSEKILVQEELHLILDAAQATQVTPPVEKTTDSTAANKTVLNIPDGRGNPKEGQLPSMSTGGARFNFQMPRNAECHIWLRVWWSGSCGNTVNLRLDEESRSITVGNDSTYGTWHWLRAPRTYKLKKGAHTLELLNREDGVRFDQLLITDQNQYVPQGIED